MRRNAFDAVRLVAAGLVLYAHSFAVLGFEQPHIFGGTVGILGVEIFFATSGYLIAASWQADPRFATFTWKRLLRIAPALAPLALVLAYVGHMDLFGTNPRDDLNPSLWTLLVEVRCYVVVAVLGLLGALHRPTVPLALFVTLVLVTAWGVNFNGGLLGGGPGSQVVVLAFAGGVLMHWIPRDRVLALTAVLALVAFPIYASHFPHYEVVWALAIPYLVIYGAERFTLSLKHDISYGLYIWGWPVQQGIVALGITAPLAIFPLALGATSVVAYGSWLAIERPALSLKRWRRVQPAALSV